MSASHKIKVRSLLNPARKRLPGQWACNECSFTSKYKNNYVRHVRKLLILRTIDPTIQELF